MIWLWIVVGIVVLAIGLAIYAIYVSLQDLRKYDEKMEKHWRAHLPPKEEFIKTIDDIYK